jgi:type I restriction enzyme S subunit
MNRWPTKPLGELCDVRIGRTPRRDEPRFWGGDAVWVTIRELNGGEITASKEKISEAAVRECMSDQVPVGTLLFSFKLSIGKMAVAGCPLYTNEAIAALPIRDPAKLSRDFLRYALLAESHEGTANAAVLGKVLNKEKVQQLPISVPPMAEQERIVKLLDEADELRKLRAQADRRTADLIPALFHGMFGDPDTNPLGWTVKRAGELMDACDYGTSQKANEEGRGIPVLRMGNVTTDGSLDLEKLKTVELRDSELAKQRLQVGDVLFNRTNSRELVGKTGVWDGRFEAVPASYFIRVRFRPNAEHPQHFTTFMNLSSMKRRLAEMARGAVGQANINSKELKSIEFPVPPVKLQGEFAARVAEIRGMEVQQLLSHQRLDALFQSLLYRAFRGEL